MNTLKKFFVALIILTLAITTVPAFSANAQEGTLGTENPFLYCSFYDENQNQVDGNALSSGDYTVNVNLSGMNYAAIMQFTANYDVSSSSAISSFDLESTYAEENSSFELAAAEVTDGELVVILNSLNLDTCSEINQNETVIATFDLTIDCEGTVDFINYFNFNTDPDLTFFMADYGDVGDCYALDEGSDIAYTVYPMTADVTPDINNNTITVSGTVLIATDQNGNSGQFGARGIKFKVNGITVKDGNGNDAVSSSKTGHYGEFSISVPKGTTEITLVGDSTINRTVTLTGTADISGASVPIVFCDYNKDSKVNSLDTGTHKKYLGGTNYLFDLNNDEKVNALDSGTIKRLVNKTVSYNELSLDS